MSSYSRNNAINTTLENELNKRARKNFINIQVNQATVFKQSLDQVPTAEPRKRPDQIQNSDLSIKNYGLEDEIESDTKQEARLVKIMYNSSHDTVNNRENNPEKMKNRDYPCEEEQNQQLQKRTSFNDVPVEYITDEGVCSPTNVDYDDDKDMTEYYDDGEDSDLPEPMGELADLSRQSMVPLHELIAYYQYIQHGDSHALVSRQSSSASQTTCKSKDSQLVEEKTRLFHEPKISELKDSKNNDCDVNTQIVTNRSQISEVQVEKNDTSSVDETLDKEETVTRRVDQTLPTPKADKRRIRANVVLELINSEKDFVKHLRDVVEGYLYPARRHPEIFTGDRINTIFANIEQLYEFQRKFLECLESHINREDLAKSEVGKCFLKFEKGFSVYHHYCNNHPNATSELQDLYTKPRFVQFFEACRLLQNMIDISLDGFLLTPIQKICKYPLQLTELLKNTDEDHPDFRYVADALESMRNCANVANERKRRIEALADVMSFQERVENWSGSKLCETSSILIHSGDLAKMNSLTWSQNVQLYLFDHLLLYAKKDLLKRNTLILKGRVSMDTVTEISDADEYKPKKSFKLYCSEQQKWFVFVARTEKEKDEWIQAFERERNLVEADENEGFQITEREIGVARRALQNRKHSRSARYRHKRPDTAIVDQLDLDDANMIMNRTLSLPSCIHPSHVMNFVEDSRVVSTRKKTTSPSASSRSPITNSQAFSHHQQPSPQNYNAQQQQQHQQQQHLEHQPEQPPAVNWFKKMGSKKLSRSHVYQVNGQYGGQQQPHQISGAVASFSQTNKVLATAASIVTDDSAAIKFDQLEKRHREHMISEEQARLFRLNNDLPSHAQIFTNRSATPNSSFNGSPSSSNVVPTNRRSPAVDDRHQLRLTWQSQVSHRPRTPQQHCSSGLSSFTNDEPQSTSEPLPSAGRGVTENSADFGLKSKLSLRATTRSQSSDSSEPVSHVGQSTESSFEANVLLSSGRVVRVREDAV